MRGEDDIPSRIRELQETPPHGCHEQVASPLAVIPQQLRSFHLLIGTPKTLSSPREEWHLACRCTILLGLPHAPDFPVKDVRKNCGRSTSRCQAARIESTARSCRAFATGSRTCPLWGFAQGVEQHALTVSVITDTVSMFGSLMGIWLVLDFRIAHGGGSG